MTMRILEVGRGYSSAVEGIGKISHNVSDFFDRPNEYGMILFTGGEDIDPYMYGHNSPKGLCASNIRRDVYEAKIFSHAIKNSIKMAGICRGLQFLNVMNGGTMIHHIDSHTNCCHGMKINSGEILVNSLHHQMVVPPEDSIIIGTSSVRLSRRYFGNEDKLVDWNGPEIESVYYPKTGCVGVQYHPEIMSKDTDGYAFFWNLCCDLISADIKEFIDIYERKLNGVQNV